MSQTDYSNFFSDNIMDKIFPAERADQFFDALFGDPAEGAYDICLKFDGHDSDQKQLRFNIQLTERPGKCLACNLTYGLPEVFSRHPVIDIKGVVSEIEKLLNENTKCNGWSLGHTNQVSNDTHIIPLTINLT